MSDASHLWVTLLLTLPSGGSAYWITQNALLEFCLCGGKCQTKRRWIFYRGLVSVQETIVQSIFFFLEPGEYPTVTHFNHGWWDDATCHALPQPMDLCHKRMVLKVNWGWEGRHAGLQWAALPFGSSWALSVVVFLGLISIKMKLFWFATVCLLSENCY